MQFVLSHELRPFHFTCEMFDAIISSNALFETMAFRELLILACLDPTLSERIRRLVRDRFLNTFERILPHFKEFCDFWDRKPIYLVGHAALYFLTRDERCTSNNIDFVTNFEYGPLLLQRLRDHDFSHVPKSCYQEEKDTSMPSGVQNRYRMERTAGKTLFQINVLESSVRDPLHTIVHYPSTHLMNFLTNNAVVSLYADLTFENIGIMRDADDNFDHNGFKILTEVDNHRTAYSACTLYRRVVYDRHTMFYHFDNNMYDNLLAPRLSKYEWNLWQKSPCSYANCQYCCPFETYKDPHKCPSLLEYLRYLVAVRKNKTNKMR
ncbi:hypothetical protein SISNIDRAFT_487436 [Sistotremastrum niveocremeum HHB9708]|uniref:Uncharacterized protein n=1 Tax=Sistotremastrum niveocremeum HHB9708 TaxID=1314777 RepID=A0A164SGJ7_9AGAM|nr:hypothetical protein SISNIDRAFT_487436 [Sistotremastrum niveocremeum HHB9708]